MALESTSGGMACAPALNRSPAAVVPASFCHVWVMSSLSWPFTPERVDELVSGDHLADTGAGVAQSPGGIDLHLWRQLDVGTEERVAVEPRLRSTVDEQALEARVGRDRDRGRMVRSRQRKRHVDAVSMKQRVEMCHRIAARRRPIGTRAVEVHEN